MLSLVQKMTLILMLGLIGFVPSEESAAHSERIPIGVMLDESRDSEIRAAVFCEAYSLGKRQQRVNISIEVMNKIDMEDSYAVGRRMCHLMANGMFAFFATHTMATIDTIKSYSSTFRMPFITTNIATKTAGQELGYEIYLRPYYAKAVVDIIKHYNWKNIWFLYDSDEGLERWSQLMDGLTQNTYSVKMHIYRVQNSTDANVTLRSLISRHDEEMTFLLDFPTKDCESLLQGVNSERRAISHRYFIVGLGVDELHLEVPRINVVGLRLVDRTNSKVLSFLRDWSRLDPVIYKGAGRNEISFEAALAVDALWVISNALQKMLSEKPSVFNQTLSDWEIDNNGSEAINCEADPIQIWYHGHDIMTALKEVELDGLTGDIKFDKFGLRRDYKLDIMEVTSSRGLEKVGQWHSERGLEIQTAAARGQRKGQISISNRTRIITSIVVEPYLFLNGPNFKGNDLYKGYCADLAKEIADHIGYGYVISPVKDGKYGWRGDDATWNGMIGELIRHEADIAIAPMTITTERKRVVDFSVPFMSTGLSIMIKKPTNDLEGAFSFLNPLSFGVWLCIIFAYFGCQVLLLVVNRFNALGWSVKEKANAKKFSVLSCLLITRRPVRSISGRMVSNVWSLATILLISFYTAKLFILLEAERTKLPINSVEDLAQQTDIKYGVVEGGSTMEFFRQSDIPVYQRMWAFMKTVEPSPFVNSNEEGLARVREGNYAFISDSNSIDYFNERAPCDTMKIGSSFNIRGYGIATPLVSDLRDRINLAVMELSESGELQQLKNKWWHSRSKCSNAVQLKRKSYAVGRIRLSNIIGLFYILIGCLILGLIILVFERLFKIPNETKTEKEEYRQKEEHADGLECL